MHLVARHHRALAARLGQDELLPQVEQQRRLQQRERSSAQEHRDLELGVDDLPRVGDLLVVIDHEVEKQFV